MDAAVFKREYEAFRIFTLTSPLCVGARTCGTTGVMISRRYWCGLCGAKPQPAR